MTGRAPFHAPPKAAASYRTVPLPQVVAEALAEHLRAFPVEPGGLLFTAPNGEPIRRTMFGEKVWRPATRKAKLPEAVFHELRHYYASLLIRHSESVKVVQARLGHATAAETLHLSPVARSGCPGAPRLGALLPVSPALPPRRRRGSKGWKGRVGL